MSTRSEVKISLLYNEKAGEGVLAANLRRELERAGHQLLHVVGKDADLMPIVSGSTDLVVAAGGDGTVWRAARALAGHSTPMAILPLGTANNIASSLGIEGSLADLIQGWEGAGRRPLDVGIARGTWGEAFFVEAVGSGLVSAGIEAMDGMKKRLKGEDSDSKVARAVRTYRDVLSQLPARSWQFTVDGHSVEGEFILLEVLNIRSVGPKLVLSSEAHPADGFFDVVSAGEEHRHQIDRYLGERLAGREAFLSLPMRRARKVEIRGWDEMHLDDQVSRGAFGTVSIEIQAGAVQLLG